MSPVRPSVKPIWILFGLLGVLPGCGGESQSTDTQNQRTTRRPVNDADATGATQAESGGDETDCLTFWLHLGHCAADDEALDENDGESPTAPEGGVNDDADQPGNDTDDSSDQGDKDDDTKKGKDQASKLPLPSLPAPSTPPPTDPNVVVFRIKAGTGSSPWNTAAEMVQVKVGQTLRLVNDDTVMHRLHTGGAPCSHGTNFAPGATYDCIVSKAFDSGVTPGGLYDHIAGPSARFHVKVQ